MNSKLRSKMLWGLALAVPLVLGVLLWNLARERPRLVPGLGGRATSIVLSRDATTIVCAAQSSNSSQEAIQTWDAGQKRFRTLDFGTARGATQITYNQTVGGHLQLSPDGRTLYAHEVGIANQKAAFAWALPSRIHKWSTARRGNPANFLFVVSPDGKRLALCHSPKQQLEIFDLTRPSPARTPLRGEPFARNFALQTTLVTSAINLDWAPDSRSVVTLNRAGGLEFWNIASGRKTGQSAPPAPVANAFRQLKFSPDGRFVALGDARGLSLYDTTSKTWTQNATFLAVTQDFPSFAWMPDSKSLWTGGDKVRRWSVPSLKMLRELPVDGPVAVSGDGKMLATRNFSQNVQGDGVLLWPLA